MSRNSCYSGASCHAQELPYVWHLGVFTDAEEALSQAMIDYWSGFASGAVSMESHAVRGQADRGLLPRVHRGHQRGRYHGLARARCRPAAPPQHPDGHNRVHLGPRHLRLLGRV